MAITIEAAVPNQIEFNIFDEVWKVYNENPLVEEESVVKAVGEKYKRTIEEIDAILVKVVVYKEEINGVMFRTANFKTIGAVTHYGYEPTNDTVTVKLRYAKGTYTLAHSHKDGALLGHHVFNNLLMVKVLIVGFFDDQDCRIDERTLEKPK